jgi:hypothetical protein
VAGYDAGMNPIDFLNDAYAYYERLNVSATGLLAIAVIFFLALLFSIREAAAWFFKVDDVKRDVRKLHEATSQLEAEIKVLQGLILQAKSHVPAPPPAPAASASIESPSDTPASDSVADGARENKKAAGKFGGFPINH